MGNQMDVNGPDNKHHVLIEKLVANAIIIVVVHIIICTIIPGGILYGACCSLPFTLVLMAMSVMSSVKNS